MPPIHIWQEEASEINGFITVSVTIEQPNQTKSHLWYRLPSQYTSLLTNSCDPFVVATIFLAMQQGTDLIVHGEVSPSLLQNLAEFQAAWHCWRPQLYQQIEITADVEREQDKIDSDQAIAAFSGGVDASFTMWRHRMKRCSRWQRNIQAGLIIHGFDIPLTQQEIFNRAFHKSREMLTSLDVELIPIATNFRELPQDWEDAFGTAIASCLMLLQGGYNTGLIGSSDPYHSLNLPYGSNPITDSLLSSNTFQIICDGSAFTRLQKVEEIANWEQACTNLRVCWQNSQSDKNCGRCEKCIRTILNFRVMGVGLPPCFAEDVTERQISEIRGLKKAQLIELEPILETAKARGITEGWVNALEKCIASNQRQAWLEEYRANLKKSFPQKLRSHLQKLRSTLTRVSKG
ncbi:MAG: hypothetical protein U7123_21810 [Potamolinea sp.]